MATTCRLCNATFRDEPFASAASQLAQHRSLVHPRPPAPPPPTLDQATAFVSVWSNADPDSLLGVIVRRDYLFAGCSIGEALMHCVVLYPDLWTQLSPTAQKALHAYVTQDGRDFLDSLTSKVP